MKSCFGIILLLIIVNTSVLGQGKQVYISKKNVQVGEPFSLRYELNYPLGNTFEFTSPLGHFPCSRIPNNSILKGEDFKELEIIKYQDTNFRNGNELIWYADFQLIAWDTGILVLEGLPFIENEIPDQFTAILVEASLVKPIKKISIYDIRESFHPLKKEFILSEFLKDNYLYLLLFVFSIIALLIIRKKLKTKKIPVKPKSLKVQTLETIDILSKKELWLEQEKNHYTELSFILRWYLTARFNISLLEKTTAETKILLGLKKLEKGSIAKIIDILKHADYVKFASSSLAQDLHLNLIQRLRQVVIETSPIEIEDV